MLPPLPVDSIVFQPHWSRVHGERQHHGNALPISIMTVVVDSIPLLFLGVLLLLLPMCNAWLIASSQGRPLPSTLFASSSSTDTTSSSASTDAAAAAASVRLLSTLFEQSDAVKTCHVQSTAGSGLIATKTLRKGDVVVGVALDADDVQLRGNKELQYLPEGYTSWTGETGLLALQVLDRVAAAAAKDAGDEDTEHAYWSAWVQTLPLPADMDHPLLWSEEDQEMLQSSSTNKIYRQLDDIEEDVQWLTEHVFDKDRERFPATVVPSWRAAEADTELPCFSLAGYTWAMALVQSRSFFLDGTLRLIPFLDACRHDSDAVEIQSTGLRSLWGSVKGAQLVADRDYTEGEEVKCSYGPKSAAEYLLDHGFVPEACWKVPVSELTFEVDPEDRFYDDKLDILEFETYNEEPMDPTQSFDVVLAGAEEQPDPAMIQFLRLCKLGATDAFLLESIFRKDGTYGRTARCAVLTHCHCCNSLGIHVHARQRTERSCRR